MRGRVWQTVILNFLKFLSVRKNPFAVKHKRLDQTAAVQGKFIPFKFEAERERHASNCKAEMLNYAYIGWVI